MRSSLLAAVLALALPACLVGTGDITGPGGTDPGSGSDPGGSGSNTGSNGSGSDTTPTPKVDVTLDKATVATELNTSNQVLVTITGSGGFSGAVDLTATLVDQNNQPLTGWTAALNQTSVTLPADSSTMVAATVVIPSQNMGLTGTLKISASSSAGTQEVTSAITAANQLTIPIKLDMNGQCSYPTGSTAALKVTVGSKVQWLNTGTTGNIVIHSNGSGEGICHENIPCNGDNALPAQFGPNAMYVQTAKTAGAAFTWYCHSPGPDLNGGNPTLQVVN